MSLRLRPRASSLPAEPSLWDAAKPYVEKLILSREGIGILSVLLGSLLKMLHTQPYIVPAKLYRDAMGMEHVISNPYVVPGSGGPDLLLYHIPIPVTVGDASSYLDWVKQLAPFGGPVGGILGMLLPSFKATEKSNEQLYIDIYLSDVFIFGGASALGSGVVSSLTGGILK